MNISLWVTPIPRNMRFDSSIKGPTPETAKLSEGTAYRVLEIHDNGDINSEAYFSLINDQDEVWFVSNRYFKVTQVLGSDGIPLLYRS